MDSSSEQTPKDEDTETDPSRSGQEPGEDWEGMRVWPEGEVT